MEDGGLMPTMYASQPAPNNPDGLDLVIDRVHDDLVAVVFPRNVSDELLAYLVAVEVRKLWSRPIKTFIPVLAMRAARERLEAFYALHQVTVSSNDAVPTPVPTPNIFAQRVGGPDLSWDVVQMRDDVRIVD